MKKKLFAWLLLGVLVTVISSVVAQTPYDKYYQLIAKSFGFGPSGQLPGGGYFAVGNADWWGPIEFSVWHLNDKGDTIKVKKYSSTIPYNTYKRWAVDAASASDGGLFILTGHWYSPSWTTAYNSVMRTNAQFDSTWCTIISPQDAWAGASLTNLIATPDGGCLVVGQTGHGDSPRILKVNSVGTISWETALPNSGYVFNSVCLTSDGGYIAVGGKSTNAGNTSNLLIAKFSSAGTTVWSKTFYSGSFDIGDKRMAVGLSVAATSDGGCMITGQLTKHGEWASSALLMRMNSSGDSLWTKKYYVWKDQNDNGHAHKILKLPSDQYLMFLEKNFTTVNELTIMKLNSSGDSLWTQVGYSYTMALAGVDNEGGIILTGTIGGANYNNCVGVFIRTTSGGMYKSPELMSPNNTYTGIDMIPTLEWRSCPWTGGPFHRPSSFRVQVARDSAFTNIVYDKSNITDTKQQTTKLLANTKYIWRVQSVGKEGSPTKWSPLYSFTTGTTTAIETNDAEVPLKFSLQQNYPNPFNPSTEISWQLAEGSNVKLKVYNTIGKEVATLVNEYQQAGKHNYQFSILHSDLSSGVYFYTLIAGNKIETKKMLLIK